MKGENKRLFFLKNYWINKVRNIPKVKVGTSVKQNYGCAIGIVSIEGKTAAELDNFLFSNSKIHAVAIEWENIKGVRITPNVYTTLKNLDVLVETIEKFAKT